MASSGERKSIINFGFYYFLKKSKIENFNKNL